MSNISYNETGDKQTVLYLGDLFYIWVSYSIFGRDVLYLGEMFYIWKRRSIFGQYELYLGKMFYIWVRCLVIVNVTDQDDL